MDTILRPTFVGRNLTVKRFVMCIITIKEFQSDPKRFIDLAEEEAVVITRNDGRPIKIEAIDSDDIPSPDELASIRRGMDDIRHGRTHSILPGESLDDFVNRIEPYVSNRAVR